MAQRIIQAASAVLQVECFDANGELFDPGTATVVVTKADGTAVSSGSATRPATDPTGLYNFAVTAAQTAALNQLQATWTFSDGSVRSTVHDIAGRFYFSQTHVRLIEASLNSGTKYTLAQLYEARLATETECEAICDRAFVPRFGRFTLSGSGTTDLILPVGDLRRIVSGRVYPYPGATTYTTLTAANLAALTWVINPDPTHVLPGDNMITRGDYNLWDEGNNNIIVEVEYGLDAPPDDLLRETMSRLRTRLNSAALGLSERATSYSTPEGQTFKLDTADAESTGFSAIDAVYTRYSRRRKSGGAAPASRQMRLQPQRFSMFHRGS